MTKDASALPPAKPANAPWLPGWGGRITIAFCLLAIAVIRTIQPLETTPFPWNDPALANILTLVFGFIAAMTLLVWFCFLSGYARLVRWITFAAVLAAVGVAAAALRFEGVDGNMVPAFAPRWQPASDRAIGKLQPAAAKAAADLLTTTDDDFPQFLGPERNAWLPGPELDRNWTANPPKLLWRRPIGAGWSAFAVVGGHAVTLEQRGEEEWVTCYEVGTGEPVWGHAIVARHYNPLGGLGPRSTPTIHGGKIYALGATGVLRCLDGKDGALVWQDDVRKRYGLTDAEDEGLVQWGRAASPLVVDDLVVVPAGGPTGQAKSLVAFHKESGDVVWEGGDSQISYSSPTLATLAGVRQILIVNEAELTAHAPETGEVLWSHPWPGKSMQDANSSQAVPVAGDRVLLTKGYGGGAELLQLTAADGKFHVSTVWKNKQILQTKFTNVVVRGEHIFGLSDGYLECVELETGRKTWKKSRRAHFGHGQILGVGELILVQAEEGEAALVEADPERFMELGRFAALDGKTWNNLCLTGKKLLVRNGEEAACFELP